MHRIHTPSRRVPALLATGLLLLPLACQSSGPGRVVAPPAVAHAVPASAIDVDHYAIDIELFPATRTLEATCRVRFFAAEEAVRRVELDLHGLDVQSVRDASGGELGFTHTGGRLAIDLAGPLAEGDFAEVTVAYSGSPKKGLWFAGGRGGQPTHVFTQGECEDSSWWFPCFDHPSDRATSELRATFPANWVSVAAGERVDRTENGATVTEHWRMHTPHPVYLTTLVAGDFEVVEDEWEGVPLLYLAEPELAGYLADGFEETPAMLSFFSELTGVRYPYAKYSQACVDNFPFGGMENISATTMTDWMLRDERGLLDYDSAGLVAHEAAHQWFGNLVTCDDWSHIWLNEGFATYATLLYFEEVEGPAAFRVRVRDTQQEYVDQEAEGQRRPLVWSVYRDPIDLFFGGQTYAGGASRLHLLRYVLGDQAFFDGIRAYVGEHQGQNVTTEDLQRTLEKVSGTDLEEFFQQWFYSPGHPDFEVDWSWDPDDLHVRLRVRQVQTSRAGTPAIFRVPFEVEVRDTAGTVVHTLQTDRRTQTFKLPAEEEPLWVRFDPRSWIPKTIVSKKEPGEWLAIASKDPEPNGRRDALTELGKLARATTVGDRRELYLAELTNALRFDEVEAVRASAARALGVAGGAEAVARLMDAARRDEEVSVRVAALESLALFGPNERLAAFGREQFEAGYSWSTMAAAAGLVASADPTGSHDWFLEALTLSSPHDLLRAGVVSHYATLDHPEVPDRLVRWAGNSTWDSNARVAAARALPPFAPRQTGISRVLVRLFGETRDYRLRHAILESLVAIDDPDARRALRSAYHETVYPREKRLIEAAFNR